MLRQMLRQHLTPYFKIVKAKKRKREIYVQRSKETPNFNLKNPTKQSKNIPTQKANYLSILYFLKTLQSFLLYREH